MRGIPGAASLGIYPPTGAVWTRSANNPIITATVAWEQGSGLGWVQEPTVLYESGTFRMWYTGGVGPNYGMGYASCTGDPTVPGNWTKYASNPVLGQGGSGYGGIAVRNSIFRDGSTLHCYFSNNTNLFHSTSTDGLSWTTPVQVIAVASLSGSPTQMTNSHVWKESANDWRMLVGVVGGTWVDSTAYFTSTDGLTWTIQNGGGPLTSLTPSPLLTNDADGPWIIKEGATYHQWYVSSVDPSGLPSANYHATSTDVINWTVTGGPAPVLYPLGAGTFEYDQVTDPCLLVVNGIAYQFYSGCNNTTNAHGYGATAPWFMIGVATASPVF